MSSDNFKGWEHVDGSKVSREETESAFNAIMQKARQIEGAYISKKIKDKTLWFKKISAAAAAVAILVLSPLAAYYIINSPADMNEYTASRGEIAQVTLPDGSTVVLNSESTLIYPEKFGRKRAVTLSGEALFTVTASKRHPFIVSTDDICVTAHGTVFNVSDYPEDLTASATLCSGVVSVCKANGDNREVTLTPDQALTLEKASGSMTVKKTDAQEATSWKDGNLRMRSLPLEQALKIVERKFNVDIHLTTDKYNDAVLTAKFINDESLVELMDALCKLIPGMQYTIEDKNIYIR